MICPRIIPRPSVTSATSICDRFCRGRSARYSKRDAEQREQDGHHDQRQPESTDERDRIAEIGAEHVNCAMTEIDDIAQP